MASSHRRTTRFRVLVPVAMAVAAIGLVAVAQAAAPTVSTQVKSISLPADAVVHAAKVKCGAGAKVTGGGLFLADPDPVSADADYFQGSHPAGGKAWKAYPWRSSSASGSSTAKISAVCIKGADVENATKSKVLPANDTAVPLTARCPRGTLVTGGGIELGDPANDFVQGTYPSGSRTWKVLGFRRSGMGSDGSFKSFALCLDKGKVKQVSKSKDMTTGELTTVTARCPRGSRLLGGGTELGDDASDYLAGSYPAGKRGWSAQGYGGSDLIAHATCLL